MAFGIPIDVNFSPLSSLKAEIKDTEKNVSKLKKEVQQLNAEGKQVTDKLLSDIERAENRLGGLRGRLASDGSKLKYQEEFNKRATNDIHNMNFRGILHNKLEQVGNKLVQSKGVQSFLNNKTLNNLTGGAASKIAEAPNAVGAFGAQIASRVAAYAPPIAVGLAIAKGFQTGMSIFNGYSETGRQEQRDYELKMSDRNFTNTDKIAEARREHAIARYNETSLGRASNSWVGYIPLVAAANFREQRKLGIDAYSTAKTERERALKESGLGSPQADRLSELAEQRLYADQYGSLAVGNIVQHTWGSIKKLWGSNSDAREVTDKVKEMADKFQKLTEEGDRRSINHDFAGAQKAYELAGKEVAHSGKGVWSDPLYVWTASDSASKANASWGQSQNPLPALRIGG